MHLSYFSNGSSVEVLEENNYYPFGLKHEGIMHWPEILFISISTAEKNYRRKQECMIMERDFICRILLDGVWWIRVYNHRADIGAWGPSGLVSLVTAKQKIKS